MKRSKQTSALVKIFKNAFVVLAVGMSATLAKSQKSGSENMHLDTAQVLQWIQKGSSFFFTQSDSSLYYMNKALDLSRKIDYDRGTGLALINLAHSYRLVGNFVQALNHGFQARDHYQLLQNLGGELEALNSIGSLYLELADHAKALDYLKQIEKQANTQKGSRPPLINFRYVWTTMGACYQGLGHLDSALMYHKKVLDDPNIEIDPSPVKALTLRRMADVKVLQGDNAEALSLYRAALATAASKGFTNYLDMGNAYNGIAGVFKNIDQQDSAIHYAGLAYRKSQEMRRRLHILESSKLLSSIYRKKNQPDSALYYQDIVVALSDSLYGLTKHRELQLLVLQQQEEYQNKLRLEAANRERIRTIALLSVLLFFFIVSLLLYRNYRSKHIAQQKIAQSYEKLKSAQSQLILSEKMASLGQLTAGIAHEIQNPLNFVNNFSEVNEELLTEMKEELAKGNVDEAKAIANDAIENQQKIIHHGRRAEDIVKSMLQHSRASSGQKEFTDINALCGEYLRLAYHGFRAKDKSFNAKFETDFDLSLPKLNVIPQDIGRVILNLINNAFYAVTEKKKKLDHESDEPTVSVTTKRSIGKVEISVKDNGNGIPESIKDKIFQPFFTTKPTGQGTGLGLSLSYDIVKAHGGELKVESEKGKGSEFLIQLPIV